jgi:hypothetical protein
MAEIEKNFILSESPNLEYDDLVEILVIAKRYGKDFIMEKGDGCRINLNKLPEDAVMQVYRYMKSTLELEDDY